MNKLKLAVLTLVVTILSITQLQADEPIASSASWYESRPDVKSKQETDQLLIHSASAESKADRDADGFYYQIKTLFTISPGSAEGVAYAKLYLVDSASRETPIHTTAFFQLVKGFASQHTITTTLTDTVIPEQYWVRVSIFQVGLADPSQSVLIGKSENKNSLFLESLDRDGYHPDLHTIYSVTVHAEGDNDHDGHFNRLNISVDADTLLHTDEVFLVIKLRDEYGDWWTIDTTPVFVIHGDSSIDTFHISVAVPAPLHFGYYDLRIEMFSAATHLLLAEYGPTPSHSDIPLENFADDTGTQVHISASASVDHVLLCILLLMLIYQLTYRAKRSGYPQLIR